MSGPIPIANTQALAYREVNADSGKKTILFIHGGLTSGDEWDMVISHLSGDYHLLMPDLPGHGRSHHVLPYSTELSSRLLLDLVREKAFGGKTYLVGFSMGAHVAVHFTSTYPHLVDALFISGYEVFSSPTLMAHALWLQHHVPSLLPKPLLRWLMDGTEIPGSNATAGSFALCRSIAKSLCFAEDQWPSPWPVRTLIVAAGKSGLLPTSDNPDDARQLRDLASKVQPPGQTRAYTHLDLIHPWNQQAPELCAKTARMWFEENAIPDGFEEL